MTADPVVRQHLLGIAAALRAEPATPDRAYERLRMLDRLEAYARAGRFPRHDGSLPARPRSPRPDRFEGPGERAPWFRDAEGTWCAVGHLLEATDPALAERVAARFGACWIAEMDDPDLPAWADAHGLSRSDLERIQPAYLCEHLEHCDHLRLAEPYALSTTCEDGADPSLGGAVDGAIQFCGTCDRALHVTVWVQNRGGRTARDVTVELTGSAWETGADTYWEEVPGDVIDRATGLVIEPGAIVAVPLLAREFTDAKWVSVSSPDDCVLDQNEVEAWEWPSSMGRGWQVPRKCPGRNCPPSGMTGDTGRCGHVDGSLGVGVLGALTGLQLLRSRRRTS